MSDSDDMNLFAHDRRLGPATSALSDSDDANLFCHDRMVNKVSDKQELLSSESEPESYSEASQVSTDSESSNDTKSSDSDPVVSDAHPDCHAASSSSNPESTSFSSRRESVLKRKFTSVTGREEKRNRQKKPLLEKHEKQTKGAAKRNRPTYSQRAVVVSRLQALLTPKELSLEDRRQLAEHNGRAAQVILTEFPWVTASQISKWGKPEEQQSLLKKLCADSKKGGRRRKNMGNRRGGGGRSVDWPKEEELLFKSIKSRREKGFKMRSRFVRAEMRRLVKAAHPSNRKAQRYKASTGWLKRFMARHDLCWRKRNNKKAFVVDKYIPKVRFYLDTLRKLRIATRSKAEAEERLQHAFKAGGQEAQNAEAKNQRRWGLLGPRYTFNVDQVPLPFVVDDGITMDFVGAERVWVKQLGSGLDKRQCTLQLCIRAEGEQPKPCLIFRGQPHKRTKDQKEEAKGYDSDVYVLWQKSAWADGATCLKWTKIFGEFRPADFASDNPIKLLLVDNLNAQVSCDFELGIKQSSTLLRQGVAGCTDCWQPVDSGIGFTYKRLIGGYYDEWLESAEAVQYLTKGTIPVSVRRQLLTQWFKSVIVVVCAYAFCLG